MALAEVPDYLQARLQTVTEVEAATAVVARAEWLRTASPPSGDPRTVSPPSGDPHRARALAEVDAAWRCRTVSDAVRDASDLLGRGYLRLVTTLWTLGIAPRSAPCRAVVVGATAAAAGLDAEDTARMIGFDDVQTVIAAALKLEPFDPALGVRWSVTAGPWVEQMVARVAAATSVDDIPAYAAPLVEQWAQQHQSQERRLYRA